MKDCKPLLSSAPAHSILNAQAFHYTNSAETDIRKTFARVRRSRAKANAPINAASNRADNRLIPFRATLPALPGGRGTAFARPAAAASRIQNERAASQLETVCVDAIPNETPAKADAAITLFARASPRRARTREGGGAAMTVLANVLPMRRTHACRHLHSARTGSDSALRRSAHVSPDTSARRNTTSRCSPPKPSAIADASVWLECSGELIDVRSVDVLRIREATPGIELIEFVCPRCRTPHASLRFG